jgi:hypothetical protein
MNGKRVVLIGGGRWGRTHANVLASLTSRVSDVLWVTAHNRSAALAAFPNRASSSSIQFRQIDDLDTALELRPHAAIVANATEFHAATALRLLRVGVPVLVEKPAATSVEDCNQLLDTASRSNVVLCVGFHLFHASYLASFRDKTAERAIAKITIDWLDPETEVRHGETKISSLSSDICDDVVPHIWTIAKVLLPTETPRAYLAELLPKGGVSIRLRTPATLIVAQFTRRASRRRRFIGVSFVDGGNATLDFTEEPGLGQMEGQPIDTQSAWKNERRPLEVEVTTFLDSIDNAAIRSSNCQLMERCHEAVALAQTLKRILTNRKVDAITKQGDNWTPDIDTMIVDELAPALAAAGYRITTADTALRDLLITEVRHYIRQPHGLSQEFGREASANAIRRMLPHSDLINLLIARRDALGKPIDGAPDS